jgi:hypothetical protein
MTFKQWLFSQLPNPKVSPYNWMLVVALAFIVGFVVTSTLLLKNKSQKQKRNVMLVVAAVILFFELFRRGVNLFNEKTEKTLHGILYTLLARPGCAISAWLAMLAVVINKRWAYAFASLIGLLCGTAFFAAPGAGFDRQLVQFEEVFSMVEHVGFYVMSLCFVTLRLAEFRFADMGKIGICFAVLAVYVFALIKGGIEPDPFLFLPNSDVHQLVGGLKYPVFLTLYIVFAHLFFGAFFVIDDRKAVKQFFNKLFKKA